jgi:hypothetical protein
VGCTYNSGLSLAQQIASCGDQTEMAIKPGNTNSPDFEEAKRATRDRITLIANALISLGAVLAVGALVWAGIQYTKAFGDDESLKKAKNTGIYALIGLILLIASFGLVDIFIRFIYQIVGAA